MTDTPTVPPTAPAKEHGRAGRNLPQAIGLGVGAGAYVVLSLLFFEPAFVLLVAVALVLASVELYQALARQDMTRGHRAHRGRRMWRSPSVPTWPAGRTR